MELYLILGCLIGIIVGSVSTIMISNKLNKKKTFGNVVLDTSNLEKDVIRFEYEKNPLYLPNYKTVIFKVRTITE